MFFSTVDLDAIVPYETEYRSILGDDAKVSVYGEQMSCNCPFHNDTTQSLSVNLAKGLFKCHSCGVTGNFITFYAKKYNLDTANARAQICQKYNISVTKAGGYDVHAYCDEKHFSLEQARSWGLEDSENGKFIRIPFKDADGQVTAVQCRHRPDSKSRFHWEEGSTVCLYGEDRLADYVKSGTVILVEGVSDTQTLWACGLPGIGVPGANGFKAEYAEKLLGFDRIIIHTDNDEAGAQFAKSIMARMRSAGFKGKIGTIQCCDLGYKDPSEVYCALGTAETTQKLTDLIAKVNLSNYSAEPSLSLSTLGFLVMPAGYFMTPGGIFLQQEGGKSSRISFAPIAITGIIEAEGAEALELAVYVRGAWKKLTMAKTDIFTTSALVKALCSAGCNVPQNQASGIMYYLSSFELANPTLPITKTAATCGWIDNEHFLPYGADGWFLNSVSGNEKIVHALQPRGSLETWIAAIAPLRHNPVFRFILASSFAAPLLDIIGVRSYAVYIWCTSGKGKTAALHAADSVWGRPVDLVASFNATAVGFEKSAAFLSGLPLAIDERQIVGSDDASQRRIETLIYTLVNGIGKVRGTRDGGLQATSEWKTVVLSTGEQPLITSSTQDGASNRTIELSDPPFDDGFNPGELYGLTEMHHGHAGEAYIRGIIAMGRTEIRRIFYEISEKVKALVAITNGSHLNDLSAAALADYLASLIVFRQTEKEAMIEALQMAATIAHSIEAVSRRDVNREAVEAISSWIVANVGCFYDAPVDTGYPPKTIFGFYNGNLYEEICIDRKAFKRMLSEEGYNYGKTVKFLREQKLIKTDKDRTDIKRTCAQYSPIPVRVICIDREALERYLSDPQSAQIYPPVHQGNFTEMKDDDELPF